MLRIVPMTEENVAEAARISAACLKEAWSEDTCRAQLKNPHDHTLIAYIDGAAAGFLSCWCIAGEAEINNICVLPDYRRKGIARAMFERIFAEIPDAECWVLEVRESNSAAIALYENLGFAAVGVRKDFYDDPQENAVIMTKE
ncbi:ribosomal protein S18-alanine N-acetyltransferase [uncultured Ruminococcus sp.]|uniref:ribosomal protein S18-alanine N-acetyltransferase n=1 Tax=uncultured Ruminococcus sp. TaxID=165186 RepID=UPI0025F106EB|nr:ribosomal protein S18-alanine N-acetyltransferase [uncultured Ruminococcus sp.]